MQRKKSKKMYTEMLTMVIFRRQDYVTYITLEGKETSFCNMNTCIKLLNF